MTQMVRTLPGTQETQVRLLGQEGHLEKELATHSSGLLENSVDRSLVGCMGSQI